MYFVLKNLLLLILNQKFWSNKNKLKPNNVSKNSNWKYWFDCDKCNHIFDIPIVNIHKNNWCPYCKNKKLCENEDCKECYEKSFATSNKAKYLKNDNPRMIFKNSNKKLTFDCNKCDHSFTKCISDVNIGGWCPFCCGQKICFEENCQDCFDKSFASQEKSKYWSSKNKENPRQVFRSAAKKYLFDCNKCHHSFETSTNDVTNNRWCPYCNSYKICFEENCKECFNKSFSSYSKSKFWSNKNKEKPRHVLKYSANKYYFNCNICKNEFYSALRHISNGKWCPHCKHKTELKLFEWLKEKYPNVQKQITFDWSQKKRYDFVINNIIIELDGPQHFKQISNWQSPEENQINDTLKNKLANDNGYRMIRICQEIVLNDLEDWEIQLINAITTENTLINIRSVYSS